MRRFRGLILTFVLCVNLGLLLADTFAPEIRITLDPTSIRAEEGHAFIFPAPTSYKGIFELKGDSPSAPTASSLQLMEDGKKLGPAHALHALIRTKGGGAYSHWGSQIYFSASDNSNPRTNRRVYVIQGVTSVNGFLQAAALAVLVCVGLLYYGARILRWTTAAVTAVVLATHWAIAGVADRKNYVRISSAERAVGLLLILICAALVFNLMDRDYEFNLDSDFDISRLNIYREFFVNLDFKQIPPPFPHPYFDGGYIVYSLVATFVAKLAALLPSLQNFLPNPNSYGLFSAELTAAVATTLACWVFYRSMVRLGTGAPLGFLLALLLCLSPQILHIDLIRIDHLILLPLLIVFHVSIMIALGQERQFHAIALGLAMAFLVNLKISGIAFAVLPALSGAAVVLRHRDRETINNLARFAGSAGVAFVLVVPLLMARFLAVGPIEFFHNYLASIRQLRDWAAVLSMSPRFYYNIDLFSDYGIVFLVIVAIAIATVLAHAVITRHSVSMFLTVSLALFSVVGVMAFKYQRGGYHLVPIYLANMGFVAALVRSRLVHVGMRWRTACTVLAALLAAPMYNAWGVYLQKVGSVTAQTVAIDRTRRQPRIWLARHVPIGSRVCLMRHSDWASVPMQGLGLKVSYGPLDFPYLDREALAHYPVPSLAGLAAECDIVIFNDFHISMYAASFHRMGLDQRLLDWNDLFKRMAEVYPPIVFTSKYAVYGVSRIEIYDLRTPK